ncbi:MAG: GGDEF domain-containing protein, partial [Cellvibrionaceae bacterium]|nr:GGDEF domain-containing protein [Cellvibrionaceae bacterium]
IAQAPELGKTETLHQNILQRWFLHVLFLGASLVVTIYSLTRALLSSKLRTLHIFMVFMSIGAGLRLIITGNLLPYLAADLTVNHQFYWSWVTFLGLLGVFVGGQPVIVPKVFASRPNLKRLFILMAYLPLLLVCLIPLLSLHTFLLSGHLLRLVYISVAIVYTVFLAIEVWRRPRGQWLQLVGTIVILVAGVSDSVVYASNRDPYIEAFAMAMFFFIVSQAIYFGWGHIRLLDRTQNLSSDLRELNANLEGQVLQRTRDLEKVNARLELAATTDVLTGLPNRRAFELEIEKEMGRAQRNPEPLCLAIVDADWFKLVNDRYGHDFGDTVLQQLAHCLRDSLRKTDFVARIGGEEFAIVLPGADLQAAAGRLAKLCAGVKELSFSQQPSYRLSISIGCAQWQGPVPAAPSTGLEPQQLAGESIDSLYKRADTALYRAKKDGRGRLELAGSASYSSD